MGKTIMLQMDISGCPTTCMHCWAQGGHYPAMAIEDINWVLDGAGDFCRENNIAFCAFPMNEIIAHPKAINILNKFRKYAELDGRYMMEPLATTGIPIAIRNDWKDILETAKQLGTTFLAFSFHGIGDVHDIIVNRKGAYKETCTAIVRTHSQGLECHANVFLTKENIKQFDELHNVLKSLNVERISWSPAFYQPTKRGRKYEEIRPDLDDLLPVAKKAFDTETFKFNKGIWENLNDYTEEALVKKAQGLNEEDNKELMPKVDERFISLVCKNNLDIYSGHGKYCTDYFGNLKSDGIYKVFERAVKLNAYSREQAYFSIDTSQTTTADLAKRWGDPKSRKLFFGGLYELRDKWLDLEFSSCRKY